MWFLILLAGKNIHADNVRHDPGPVSIFSLKPDTLNQTQRLANHAHPGPSVLWILRDFWNIDLHLLDTLVQSVSNCCDVRGEKGAMKSEKTIL